MISPKKMTGTKHHEQLPHSLTKWSMMMPRHSLKNGLQQSPISASIGTWQTRPTALRSQVMRIFQRSAAPPPLNTIREAISLYMPQQNVVWDEVQKEGNPTKSWAVNNLIKEVERHEVRGTVVASPACRPIEWDEYTMLLLAAHLVFSQREKSMYMILAVMMLQWHFISQINNIMCLVTTTIQQILRHPFCLQLKMCKSKIFRSKQDMPMQVFFASMDPLVRPVLNLAVYVDMFGMQGLGQKKLIGRVLADLLSTLKNCSQVLISNQQGLGDLEPTASARVLQPTQAGLAF
jgi:hypothetical protein